MNDVERGNLLYYIEFSLANKADQHVRATAYSGTEIAREVEQIDKPLADMLREIDALWAKVQARCDVVIAREKGK